MFDVKDHNVGHNTFMRIVDALNCGIDERPFPGTRYLLRLSNAEEEGETYESRMLDSDTFSMLSFKSDWDGIHDVRVLVPSSKG